MQLHAFVSLPLSVCLCGLRLVSWRFLRHLSSLRTLGERLKFAGDVREDPLLDEDYSFTSLVLLSAAVFLMLAS